MQLATRAAPAPPLLVHLLMRCQHSVQHADRPAMAIIEHSYPYPYPPPTHRHRHRHRHRHTHTHTDTYTDTHTARCVVTLCLHTTTTTMSPPAHPRNPCRAAICQRKLCTACSSPYPDAPHYLVLPAPATMLPSVAQHQSTLSSHVVHALAPSLTHCRRAVVSSLPYVILLASCRPMSVLTSLTSLTP